MGKKRHARAMVNKAVLDGDLVRPGHCSKCEKACKPDGHHPDYDKPLEVVWLCRKCHFAEHAPNGFGRPGTGQPKIHRDTHHVPVPVSVQTRDRLDAIVDQLRGKRMLSASRGYVIYQLAVSFGPALIRHLTEPVRVGKEER